MATPLVRQVHGLIRCVHGHLVPTCAIQVQACARGSTTTVRRRYAGSPRNGGGGDVLAMTRSYNDSTNLCLAPLVRHRGSLFVADSPATTVAEARLPSWPAHAPDSSRLYR